MIASRENLSHLLGRVNLETGSHLRVQDNLGGVRIYEGDDEPPSYLTETIPIDNAIAYLEGCLYNHYLN